MKNEGNNREHAVVFPSHDSLERITVWRISFECLKYVDYLFAWDQGCYFSVEM